jgi:putative copper resistance protein D
LVAADALSVILRGGSLVLLLTASGAALFRVLFRGQLERAHELLRPGARALAFGAMAAVAAQYALEAARLSGEFSGMLDSTLQRIVLGTPLAGVAALRILALLFIVLGLPRSGRSGKLLALAGAGIAVGSFALVGHTAAHSSRAVLAGALIVHVAAVSFWLGALAALLRLCTPQTLPVLGRVVQSFSAIAVWVVPVLFLAGTFLAVALIGQLRGLLQPYGLLILVKLAAFSALIFLAGVNKWRWGPALSRGDESALQPFRRAVAAEYAVIACVLAVTAVLTTFFSP